MRAAALLGTALTGAAVLRAAGRIYLGLGPDPGDEARAPTDEEREKADRPLWLMLLPCVALLGADLLVPADLARSAAARVLPQFALLPGPVALPEPTAWTRAEPWLALLGTAGVAGFALFREGLPRAVPSATDRAFGPLLRGLDRLHSGVVNDYVVWLALGVALFAGWASL